MPPIGLELGGVDFSQLAVNLNEDGSAAIRYGRFISAVVAFVVVAFVVWRISQAFIKAGARAEGRPDAAVPVLPRAGAQGGHSLPRLRQRDLRRGGVATERSSR